MSSASVTNLPQSRFALSVCACHGRDYRIINQYPPTKIAFSYFLGKKGGKGTPSFNAVPFEEFVECIHDAVSARDRENYGRKKRSLVWYISRNSFYPDLYPSFGYVTEN